jgi:hypothetical protein
MSIDPTTVVRRFALANSVFSGSRSSQWSDWRPMYQPCCKEHAAEEVALLEAAAANPWFPIAYYGKLRCRPEPQVSSWPAFIHSDIVELSVIVAVLLGGLLAMAYIGWRFDRPLPEQPICASPTARCGEAY